MSLHSSEQTPMSKKDFLVIEEMANEVLVYNTTNNKLHILSPVAAEVWKRCDGKTSIREIANQLVVGTDAGTKEDIVQLALKELEKVDLLQNRATLTKDQLSRRSMLQKTALATALALPFITTMIAPSPTHAQSGPSGGPPGPGGNGNGGNPCGGNCGSGGGGGGGNGTGNEGNGNPKP